MVMMTDLSISIEHLAFARSLLGDKVYSRNPKTLVYDSIVLMMKEEYGIMYYHQQFESEEAKLLFMLKYGDAISEVLK